MLCASAATILSTSQCFFCFVFSQKKNQHNCCFLTLDLFGVKVTHWLPPLILNLFGINVTDCLYTHLEPVWGQGHWLPPQSARRSQGSLWKGIHCNQKEALVKWWEKNEEAIEWFVFSAWRQLTVRRIWHPHVPVLVIEQVWCEQTTGIKWWILHRWQGKIIHLQLNPEKWPPSENIF